MTAPSIESIRIAIAAASGCKTLRVRVMHAAVARARLTALVTALNSEEISLLAIETELARATANSQTWGDE